MGTLDELSDLVKLSPLKFQNAYAGSTHADSGKCPFLPAPGDKTAAHIGACPWPFVMLHDPKTALALHPMKNVGAAIALYSLGQAAWRYPKSVLLGMLATIPALWWLKPRLSSLRGHGHRHSGQYEQV